MKKTVSVFLCIVFLLSLIYLPSYAEDNFSFTLSNDKSYYILVSYNGNETEAVIPEKYKNLPIKEIADGAFSGNISTYKITIPNSVVSIGDTAFCGMPSLNEFAASGSSFVSENGVLFSVDKKTIVSFPQGREGVYTIGDNVTSLSKYSFYCSSLSEVIFNSKITVIPEYAFYGSSIEFAEIPSNVKTVSAYAFAASSLKKIKIDGAASIKDYAFSFCKSLVFAGISYASLSGVGIFSGCQKLTALDSRVDHTIPEYTFAGCTGLITAPTAYASSVGQKAFYGCVSLENVCLPSKDIAASNAFDNCDNIVNTVYYDPDTISANVFNYSLTSDSEFTPDIVCSGEYDLFTDSTAVMIDGSVVKTIREGDAEIYAVAKKGGACAVITVSVNDGTAVIESDHPYKPGQTVYTKQINGASKIAVTFASSFSFVSDDSITITDSKGNIYGHFSGNSLCGKTLIIEDDTVILTLKAFVGGEYGFRVVSVKNADSLVKMTSVSMVKSAELNVGETLSLNASPIPADAFPSEIVYVSSDTSIALVDDDGNVTGINSGSAVIRAYSSAYGVSASCTVTVKENIYNGFVYETSGNEAYISYYKGSESDCVIPSGINGYTVTKILDGAFSFSDIKTVKIPKTVKYIGNDAFFGCTSMTAFIVEDDNPTFSSSNGALTNYNKMILLKVPCGIKGEYKIPDTVNFAGVYAFNHCFYITSIDVNNVYSFSAAAVRYCSSLKSYKCSGSAYKIVDGTLYSSDKKTLVSYPPAKTAGSFSIPEGTTKIAEGAFNSNPYLEFVSIPSTITDIDSKAFMYCSDIVFFTVSSKNQHFYADDGLLYKDDTLVSVPGTQSGTVKIKENTVNIAAYAFYGCNRVTSVIMPQGLQNIGSYAFAGCTSIQIMVYPESVIKTEKGAYDGCDRLSLYIPDSYITEYRYGCRILCGKGTAAEQSCIDNGCTYSYGYLSSDKDIIAVTNVNATVNVDILNDKISLSKVEVLTCIDSFTLYGISFKKDNKSVSCGYTYLIDTDERFYDDTYFYENGILSLTDTSSGVYIVDSDLMVAVSTGEKISKEKLSVKKLPDKTEYDTDDIIDLTGIELYYTTPEGRTVIVSDGIKAIYDFSTTGRKSVTVIYGEAMVSFNVNVTDNKISGSISISGSCVYGNTVYCDIMNLKPANASIKYQWFSDGKAVSGENSNSYTIRAADIDKAVKVTVIGTGEYSGTLTSEAVTADKAKADPPPKPKALLVTSTTVTLEAVQGCEYRLSGQSSYSDSTVFTGLTPGRNYTFYQRKKETDTHYASDRTSLTVTTPSSDAIESYYYKVNSSNGIISLVEPQTTVNDFLKNLKNSENVSVYKNGTEIKGTANVGTGTEVRLYSAEGKLLASYKLVTTGDINGDGKVNMTDYLQIKERIIKNKTLDIPNEYACDVNGDGKITMTDYLRLKYCIQGHEKLIQNEY